MNKSCIGFEMDDAQNALEHMKYEKITDYGDYAYGHNLHTWDDGKRILVKCKNCGGYILIQDSEYHSFGDSGDSYYTDYFPVDGEEQADELNRKYDGITIEREFPTRYLCVTNRRIHWSK